MQEPSLVVLAAGMGSRFGGLKQITAVDDFNHAIIDFSLYDAYRAGFKKLVFVIKHEIEDSFKEFIGYRMEKYFQVSYVYQQLDMLPEGYSVPEGREKPWGTGHAVLCCKDVIDGPFVVINSDDFYGAASYKVMYDYLTADRPSNQHSMLAYYLKNTVTENGSVARGVCHAENGFLTDIVERTHIEKDGDNAKFTEDGEHFFPLPGDTLVSMNYWGFGHEMFDELEGRFSKWLDKYLPVNPLKCEYFLPYPADLMIKEGTGSIEVLSCDEKWYGVTYREDLPGVYNAIKAMRAAGRYPEFMLD